MKLKELESYLQGVEGFENPQIQLEQYATSPHIASHMLYTIDKTFNDIAGNVIADFGCGCGVLTAGCGLLSAELVFGFDIDSSALDIAQRNIENFELDQSTQLIQCNVTDISLQKRRMEGEEIFDAVVMNPPFGTKNNQGVDLQFVQRALDICNGSIYSLHKTSTRDYILKKSKDWNSQAEVLARLHFDLPKSYKFHKKRSVDVEVDFIRFTHL